MKHNLYGPDDTWLPIMAATVVVMGVIMGTLFVVRTMRSVAQDTQEAPLPSVQQMAGDDGWCEQGAEGDCLAALKRDGGKSFVVYGEDSCPYCSSYAKEALADPRVIAVLASFSRIHVDTEKNEELADVHGVETIPLTVISDGTPDGRKAVIEGSVGADELLGVLRMIP